MTDLIKQAEAMAKRLNHGPMPHPEEAADLILALSARIAELEAGGAQQAAKVLLEYANTHWIWVPPDAPVLAKSLLVELAGDDK